MEESVGRVEVRGSGVVVGRGGGNYFSWAMPDTLLVNDKHVNANMQMN